MPCVRGCGGGEEVIRQALTPRAFVPGMDVPDDQIERLKGVPKEKVAEEGIKIAVETIQRCRQIKGVADVHIMAIEWEEKVPEIVQSAGLYPRPN
jgi:methylenetetrahydrofolate reductase (NADPH)